MTPPRPVRRRFVLYVSGFDPNGPSRYHRLYAEGARQRSSHGDAEIETGPRQRLDPQTMGWTLRWRPRPGAQAAAADTPAPAEPEAADPAGDPAGDPVHTDYVFPRWDGIVRDHWWQGDRPLLRDLFVTSWYYLRTGALWRVLRQSWTAFHMVVGLATMLVVAAPGLAALFWTWGRLALAWRAGEPLGALGAASAAGLGLLALWAYWTRRYWHSRWVLRSYAFTGRMSRQGIPALEHRLDEMAGQLCRQARTGDYDEILVVGHSLGSAMAVSVLGRALQQDPDLTRHGPSIALLTLGHAMPLISNLPAARRFRDELATLAAEPALCWVDFSDALDDYSFSGVDPVRAAGIAARPDHPRMRQPGFARLFEPGPHQIPRLNLHEIHQQYLAAGPPGQAYDYFAITAGPLRLTDRFPTQPR